MMRYYLLRRELEKAADENYELYFNSKQTFERCPRQPVDLNILSIGWA